MQRVAAKRCLYYDERSPGKKLNSEDDRNLPNNSK